MGRLFRCGDIAVRRDNRRVRFFVFCPEATGERISGEYMKHVCENHGIEKLRSLREIRFGKSRGGHYSIEFGEVVCPPDSMMSVERANGKWATIRLERSDEEKAQGLPPGLCHG